MLQVYTFQQIVSNIATAVQASASSLFNFTVGSVLRAIAESTASVALWLQAIVLKVLTFTRAATSTGADLDSWMADYSFPRESAVAASGIVTFSRFTASQQAVVQVGASVQTGDGTQSFVVTADTANGAYNASLGGYVLPVNTDSVSVPVQATVPGTGANVIANTITVITTPIVGVDTVTNSAAFTNGIDAESDAAYRARFVLYLSSLSKGTKAAIASAIANVEQGIQYTFTENADYDGTPDNGFFYVVVDDGSGSPSSTLLAAVSNAIDAVRAFTIRFAVFAPVVVTANVSMTVVSASGYIHANVVGAVGTALTNFINAIPLGTALPYTQLAAVAYSVPGVVNVTAVVLNGGTADLTATNKQVIKSGTITIA